MLIQTGTSQHGGFALTWCLAILKDNFSRPSNEYKYSQSLAREVSSELYRVRRWVSSLFSIKPKPLARFLYQTTKLQLKYALYQEGCCEQLVLDIVQKLCFG